MPFNHPLNAALTEFNRYAIDKRSGVRISSKNGYGYEMIVVSDFKNTRELDLSKLNEHLASGTLTEYLETEVAIFLLTR